MTKLEPLRLSQQQEKRIAKKVGGTLNAGSGNQRKKNDVRQKKDVLWEMKRTNARTITIKATDLEDLRRNATLEGRRPVMHIELGKRRYVLMEEDEYFEMATFMFGGDSA